MTKEYPRFYSITFELSGRHCVYFSAENDEVARTMAIDRLRTTAAKSGVLKTQTLGGSGVVVGTVEVTENGPDESPSVEP